MVGAAIGRHQPLHPFVFLFLHDPWPHGGHLSVLTISKTFFVDLLKPDVCRVLQEVLHCASAKFQAEVVFATSRFKSLGSVTPAVHRLRSLTKGTQLQISVESVVDQCYFLRVRDQVALAVRI